MFVDIFYYNTPIHREILCKFLQFTDKYYVNRTPFHFRRRAEAVLRRAARLVLARLKMVLSVDLSRAIWKSSGTPQHNTASKIGLSYSLTVLERQSQFWSMSQLVFENKSVYVSNWYDFSNLPEQSAIH